MTLRSLVAFCTLFAVLSCSSSDDTTEIILEDISDRYIGVWEGNLGNANVPISMRVTRNVNSYEGPFWVSGNYMACCGNGAHNGLVTYSVEGNQILDFVWRSEFPGCPGVFTGSGMIGSDDVLEIAASGDNCDGHHIANLRLNKQD